MLQTSQLFAVYCSSSCIIILVFVLKCSKPQDHKVNSIISIKQHLHEFEINSQQSVSCKCHVQQSASNKRRRSSPHKPVSLKQRLTQQRSNTVDHKPGSTLLIEKLKCLIRVNNSCMHVVITDSYYSYDSCCWANKQQFV